MSKNKNKKLKQILQGKAETATAPIVYDTEFIKWYRKKVPGSAFKFGELSDAQQTYWLDVYEKELKSKKTGKPDKKIGKIHNRKNDPEVLPKLDCLWFTPYAYAKIQAYIKASSNEVSAFGITGQNPLLVEDVELVKQTVDMVVTTMDAEGIADFFEKQVMEHKRHPSQFGRIWIHSHPGMSPHPSPADENTFAEVFGKCDYGFMVIFGGRGDGGKTYCRMQMQKPLKFAVNLTVEINHSANFSEHQDKWQAEYDAMVEEKPRCITSIAGLGYYNRLDDDAYQQLEDVDNEITDADYRNWLLITYGIDADSLGTDNEYWREEYEIEKEKEAADNNSTNPDYDWRRRV